jgi:hypothetical protein
MYAGIGALIDNINEGRTLMHAAEPLTKGPVHEFTDLWRKTRSGEIVYVQDDRDRSRTGTFVRASSSSVTVAIDGTLVELPVTSVSRLSRRGDSLSNGASIGVCLGILSGIATGSPVGLALNVTIYTGLGMLVDAGVHGRTVIYTPQTTRQVKVAPFVGRKMAGLTVSF